MEGFDFVVEHRPGRSHGNADAMSRIPEPLGTIWEENESDDKDEPPEPCHERGTFTVPTSDTTVEATDTDVDEAELPEWRHGHSTVNGTNNMGAYGTSHLLRAVDEVDTSVAVSDGLDERVVFDLAGEQRADPDLIEIIKIMDGGGEKPPWDVVFPWSGVGKALWHQWDRLRLMNGLLYRQYWCSQTSVMDRQVVVPHSMREMVIRLLHEGVGVSHLKRTRTEGAVVQRAYWVGWTSDVRRVLRKCEACTRYIRGTAVHRTPLKPIVCGEPWEMVSIDITGPHPTSYDGYS